MLRPGLLARQSAPCGAASHPTNPAGVCASPREAAPRYGPDSWPSIVRKMPAAMTVPMTPARFGPIANISR